METLYQCTIFVDLALLAIVIAIFVFASSFYRGALELSIKEEENSLNRRKELINSKRNELGKKLRNANESALPKELRAELDKFDAELKNIDQSIIKSRNKPKALSVRNMVTIPGSSLLASIVASGTAIATSETLPTIMWPLSLVLLAAGLYFIYKNLSAVEFFSGIIDLSTLMEQALERHAQKSTPIVDLEIWNPKLEVQRGKTLEINYDVSLKQGTIARKAHVRFSGTEELDFPNQKIEQETHDYNNMKKPKRFWHGFEDINPKEYKHGKFEVKAPEKPGAYTMAYWLQCEGYTEEEITFKINVI